MMECKKALVENDGDFDAAIEALRISGAAKAAKRGAEREATNGLVVASNGALVELLCETDFVAKNADFLSLANQIVAAAAAGKVGSRDALLEVTLESGRTVKDEIEGLSAVIGEKLELGRVTLLMAQWPSTCTSVPLTCPRRLV
jgi:elongation factor Ts